MACCFPAQQKVRSDQKRQVYIDLPADRVNHTLQLYKNGIHQKVLISAEAEDSSISENQEGRRAGFAATAHGISKENILIEHDSRIRTSRRCGKEYLTGRDHACAVYFDHLREFTCERSAAALPRSGGPWIVSATDFLVTTGRIFSLRRSRHPKSLKHWVKEHPH